VSHDASDKKAEARQSPDDDRPVKANPQAHEHRGGRETDKHWRRAPPPHMASAQRGKQPGRQVGHERDGDQSYRPVRRFDWSMHRSIISRRAGRASVRSAGRAMLLCLSSHRGRVFEEAVEVAGEVALEAAVPFAPRLALLESAFEVGDRRGVRPSSGDQDEVERSV
jgi:hypothetical protein